MAEPRSSAGDASTLNASTSGDTGDGDGGGNGGVGIPPGAASGPTAATALVKPPKKRRRRGLRVSHLFRGACRTFPVFTPKCSRMSAQPICRLESHKGQTGTRITGTLFGYRKGRVSLSLQEIPQCLPSLVVELAIQTHVLLREMSSGMVRIALECEKRHGRGGKEARVRHLLDEPVWAMFCNGKRTGYGVKREASEEDIRTMELLRAVSMGAGVLPGKSETEGPDGEVAYMRANFEHVVGSRDSETLYMISPEGKNGPDLTIFFVRI